MIAHKEAPTVPVYWCERGTADAFGGAIASHVLKGSTPSLAGGSRSLTCGPIESQRACMIAVSKTSIHYETYKSWHQEPGYQTEGKRVLYREWCERKFIASVCTVKNTTERSVTLNRTLVEASMSRMLCALRIKPRGRCFV